MKGDHSFGRNTSAHQETTTVTTFSLSQNNKKGMSADEIILQPSHQKSSMHGKASMHNYSVHIPVGLDIPKTIETIRHKIGHNVVYYDQDRGQILVQTARKVTFWDCLDCLLFCRIEGSTKGSLANSYKAIAIRVTKDAMKQRCTITVKPTHPRPKDQFFLSIIKIIESQIKHIKTSEKSYGRKIKNQPLDIDSPIYKQIEAFKTINTLISSSDKRYVTLFDKANEKMEQIIFKQSSQNFSSKVRMSDLIETLVSETNSLFNAFTYDQRQNCLLHPEYCLYAIECQLCHQQLPKIIKIYSQQMKQQNKIYNQQCILINKQFTNETCWKYLQCKNKYTLPSQQQPYFTAILALREIINCNSLRQMLLSVQKCFSEVKLCCLYEHQSNVQLATMDDILPVMIYVVVRAGINNFPSYVKLVDDYIRARGTFELQERIITTLYVAVEDISKKWAMKSLKQHL